MEKARKRIAAIGERLTVGSISIGVAQLEPDDSPEDLIARADAAL